MELYVLPIIMIQLLCNNEAQINLGTNGTASQKSNYGDEYRAENAIDTNIARCSITGGYNNDEYDSWWRFTFPQETVYITNVNIWFRHHTNQDRHKGYSLYISNITDKHAGHVCFKDPGTANTLSSNQTGECNKMGKYITIFNERQKENNNYVFIEICYIEIYGCYKTFYGNLCRTSCSPKCFDRHCYPNNGSCIWGCNCLHDNCDNSTNCMEGCKKRYAGTYCDKYNLASDGISSLHLSHGNQQSRLAIDGDKSSGSCLKANGSGAWWQVDLGYESAITVIYITYEVNDLVKHKAASHDLYIAKMNDQMSEIKLNMTSDFDKDFPIITYEMTEFIIGQYIRYIPRATESGLAYIEICEVEVVGCPRKWFGPDCNISCPKDCLGSCHPTTGLCSIGCNDGWKNSICSEKCEHPSFGKDCRYTCNCAKQPCNHINGTCPSGGCLKGWEGITCSQGCSDGRFGFNCNESCLGCLGNECDRFNGVCTNTSACKPGWKLGTSSKCDITCDDGTFGNCARNCHCRYGTCEKVEGNCPNNQCDKGWTGNSCSRECGHGYFGYNCDNHCNTCFNSTCDRLEGNCTYGCIVNFEGHLCSVERRQTQTAFNVVAFGAGIVAAIMVLVLGIIIVLIIRRRRASSSKNSRTNRKSAKFTKKNIYSNNSSSSSSCLPSSIENDKNVEEEHGGSNTNLTRNQNIYCNVVSQDDIYYNMSTQESQTKINILDLTSVVKEKQCNDGEGFQHEFEGLPKGLVLPHVEGSREENKMKNRFLTTWPYDHSRVILHGNGSSDYINASYINSYSQEKAYIATQGPKKNTIQDFWHLIWQENVETIVMLTRFVEQSRKKCEQYWPETFVHPLTMGKYDIRLVKEIKHFSYVYRTFNLLNTKEKTLRTVYHYHFMQWPDHGVPDIIRLVEFYRRVTRTSPTLNGPWVVHCSAGVGRTGTFIAIDMLYKNGITTGFVDIMECVEMMRKDRMNMIQTREQYEAVFESLLELFNLPDKSVEISNFCSYLDSVEHNPEPRNQTSLKVEFQKLQDLKPVYLDQNFSCGLAKENITKNVSKDILPHDSFRPYLISFEKSRNDYINAVIVPGFSDKGHFIASQYPLKETNADFWTMVYDHDCSAVVVLESDREDAPLLPRHGEQFDFEKLSLEQGNSKSLPLSLTLHNKEKNDSRLVGVILMTDWMTDNVPSSEKCMINLLKKVTSWRNHHPGSVAVVCHDGCKRCGLFIALNLVLEKIEMDDTVDIFHVARLLQIRRPEFLSYFDQYKFCYYCIKEYLEENSLYANA